MSREKSSRVSSRTNTPPTSAHGQPGLVPAARRYVADWCDAWNRFWFAPSDPATLGLMRILAGAMLVYTHLVWGKDLLGFFGPEGRLPAEFSSRFYGDSGFAWSYLYWIEDSAALFWTCHIIALLILIAFTVGFKTRVTGVLAFIITASYANRAAGALFGLDQINGFLALYMAVGPSGAVFSVDSWLRRRKAGHQSADASSNTKLPGATMSIRLIQLHMCVVYLFAGLGKLQGETWWNGEAFWGAVANAEYQSMDLTWLASYPLLVNVFTQVSVAWEVSYAALVWPRRTRPFVLLLCIPLHLGIALGMGMMTFGSIMIVANGAFVRPEWIRVVQLKLAGLLFGRGPNPHSAVESPA